MATLGPRHSRLLAVATALGGAVLLAACSSATGSSPATSAVTTTTRAPVRPADEAAIVAAGFSSPSDRRDSAGTVWLCRPGLADDPCAGDLAVTTESSTGAKGLAPGGNTPAALDRPADCFYVYPTTSTESTENANLAVQAAEVATAKEQAAQFSRDCEVWAPIYRQVTVNGLFHPIGSAARGFRIAMASALATFEDYLHHFNHGRPIVLIGHSQGAAAVIHLIQETMDDHPATRRLLVSAIILGGNVVVPVGRLVGGSFSHVPVCTSASETGCVIAYSSFDTTPPADTLFGKPGTGVSALLGQRATAHLEVVCTNPADLSTGSGPLLPIFVAGPPIPTPYVEYPDLYTGRCVHRDGVSWLQVDTVHHPHDPRPVVQEVLGPAWGLHLYDVNLTLGDLVVVVHSEITSWLG